MADLAKALEFTLEWEGGFVDDPDDPGGRTKFGINERDHPDAWENGPPTEDQAREIYRRDYWDPLGADEIDDQRVATYLFDTAVNQGHRVAGRVAQRAANLFQVGLTVDGVVGPKTREALNFIAPERLIHGMVAYRSEHHVGLAEAKDNFRKFVFGWLRRDHAILDWRP